MRRQFSRKLGARFAPGVSPLYPHIDAQRLRTIEPFRVTPAFKRRAFASDIMTWNYSFADRLELHLRHDREFISWMARRGINAFSYIRHAHDTRLKIDELAPLLRERGIDAEYAVRPATPAPARTIRRSSRVFSRRRRRRANSQRQSLRLESRRTRAGQAKAR